MDRLLALVLRAIVWTVTRRAIYRLERRFGWPILIALAVFVFAVWRR